MLRVLALGKGLVQGNAMQEEPRWALAHDSEAMRDRFQSKPTPAAPSLRTVDAGETASRSRMAPLSRASQRHHSKERAHQLPRG